ncbi:hypothetical protein BKA62DRAFT_724234 [Auriculariales sp. MPI-PUGE-AT-0066]|nr:hypothetical protein BKA62DRAFT_724234 [Auriculariales sp. MPI-PUGE-AT-0066]
MQHPHHRRFSIVPRSRGTGKRVDMSESTAVRIITDLRELPNGYCQMIAFAWFAYDFALTFSDERRRLRWNAALFLSTRYFTFALLVMSVITCTVSGFSQLGCSIFDWAESIGTIILVALVQIILQTRIYVIYGRSRRILIANIALFSLEAIIAGIMTALYFGGEIQAIVPTSTLGSCFAIRQKKLAAVWAAPLAFETYLAVLAVHKLREEWQLMRLLHDMSIMTLIIRDNILYFLLIIMAMITNIVCEIRTELNPGISVITIVHAVGAIGGSRIVLSLLHGTEHVFAASIVMFKPQDSSQSSSDNATGIGSLERDLEGCHHASPRQSE